MVYDKNRKTFETISNPKNTKYGSILDWDASSPQAPTWCDEIRNRYHDASPTFIVYIRFIFRLLVLI